MPPLTAESLYAAVAIEASGTTAWGKDVPSDAPGVYVISVIDPGSVQFIDHGAAQCERERWSGDQEIVYIGRAKRLSRRLKQFRKHIYGAPSPHRGGQAILLLDSPKIITWAVADDYADAEHRLITAFQEHTGRMPFGNRMRSAKMVKPPMARP